MPTELMESLGEQLAGYEELARIAGEQLARILEEDTQGFDRAVSSGDGKAWKAMGGDLAPPRGSWTAKASRRARGMTLTHWNRWR